MRIGELAARAGLSADTIRFYERRGLIERETVARLENGYRVYSEAALERLKLISRAKCLGFTLNEIYGSLKEWESNRLNQREKEELFRNKIVMIEERIAQLEEMKHYLLEKIERIHQDAFC